MVSDDVLVLGASYLTVVRRLVSPKILRRLEFGWLPVVFNFTTPFLRPRHRYSNGLN